MDGYQDEIQTMAEQVRLGRRGFAVTSLAAGFALAVRPVSATTITTDTNGLTAVDVKIPVSGGFIPGYRALPIESTGSPTVLVIHEVFGVHEHIKDICRRLAKAGYYAVAPLLYSREGDVSTASDIQQVMAIVGKVKDDQVKTDLDSALAFAKAEKANVAKLGVTGFCWGGRQTWLYVAANPAVKAGVAWYGPLAGRTGGPSPNPLDVADKIKGRMLGLYGGQDQMITAATIDEMRSKLAAAGDTKSAIVVYPDAQHGFNADYRPSYNETAAKDGWAKMLAWFKTHGVA
jgi:carboxymethylenebutenolidase